MRIGIISDIHSNLEAFQNVLADLQKENIEKLTCLGDIIGYGPQPEETVNTLIEMNIISTMGNHELALFDNDIFDQMNSDAQDSIKLTKKNLSEESLHFLSLLPKMDHFKDLLFTHGCPPDRITAYISRQAGSVLLNLFESFSESIAFVGHTHDLKLYEYSGTNVNQVILKNEKYFLDQDKRYIVNIGSVGQPRDGNSTAKYVIYDENDHCLEVRYVRYNIDKTVQLLKEKGFPEINGKRLYLGK